MEKQVSVKKLMCWESYDYSGIYQIYLTLKLYLCVCTVFLSTALISVFYSLCLSIVQFVLYLNVY